MAKVRMRGFQFRVTLAFILSMVFVCLLSNVFIYKFALDAQFQQLRDKLKVIAQTAALMIDAESVRSIPLSKDSIDLPQYKTLVSQLRKIREFNPPIYSVYVMVKTPRRGILRFVADADLPNKEEIAKGITFYPGDEYDASRFPEMLEAFDRAGADNRIGRDEWGVILSGYAPIRDASGASIALLGVDIFAEDVYLTQRNIHIRGLLVFLVGVLVSLVWGSFISRRLSSPIKELIHATDRIAQGDLGYTVAFQAEDELGVLSKAFNRMAQRLTASRKRLHAYFYNVMQSLVLILEAKDKYTEGHSKRVAEYAVKLGKALGFDREKLELLRETALLHDIGKIGVQESILNKEGPLTASEWEAIRKHPVIGEEVLKPVTISPEMLQMVRSHHERFDGQGYPDRLKGEEIGIFVAIISLADAYDAMTSQRAYRAALPKEAAMAELRKNRGAQFHPAVVDAFIALLAHE